MHETPTTTETQQPSEEQELQQPQSYAYIKIVQSGTRIEVTEYERQPNPNPKPRKKQRIQKERHRARRNVARSRANFIRMVRASLLLGSPAFLTLTMVGICDIATAYRYYTKFTQNMRKKYGKQIAWIAVPEFQKRDAVHFHVLLWGLTNEQIEQERNTRNIQACWLRGWVDILASDGSPKIAGYMAKYMSKTMFDDRLKGKKSYTVSRNTLRSKYYRIRASIGEAKETSKERFKRIRRLVPVHKSIALPFTRVYNTEWLGRCRQSIYEISDLSVCQIEKLKEKF